MSWSRRDFLKTTAGTTLGLYSSKAVAKEPDHRRESELNENLLSVKAHKNADFEGEKIITDIEGDKPSSIIGRYIKIAPGMKKNFGQNYNHFFDGDAFVYSLNFSADKIKLKAKFIETPERKKEQRRKRQIYSEFGTSAGGAIKLKKDSPSINIIPWNNRLLCLSDTSLPIALDYNDYSFLGEYNFSKTLSKRITFTAHPKRDPRSDLLYAYGITKSLSPELEIYEIDPKFDEAKKIQSHKLDYIPMIHDMMITENYVLVLAPPMKISVFKMLVQQKSYAESLELLENITSTLYVFPKNSNETPFTIKAPRSFSFHNGNAYEDNGLLHITTFAASDASLFDYLSTWNQNDPEVVTSLSQLRQWTIDLSEQKLIDEILLYEGCDFPRMNENFLGVKNRYLYSVGQNSKPLLNSETEFFTGPLTVGTGPLFNENYSGDLLAFKQIVKYDLEQKTFLKREVPIGQTIGEVLFVANEGSASEDDGHLLCTAYDEERQESFFDILDARNLSLKTRIWLGCYVPMGFHGNFI